MVSVDRHGPRIENADSGLSGAGVLRFTRWLGCDFEDDAGALRSAVCSGAVKLALVHYQVAEGEETVTAAGKGVKQRVGPGSV